jgi:hypothetical protein
MKTRGLLIPLVLLLFSVTVFAQHEDHQMKSDTTKKEMKHNGKRAKEKAMNKMDHSAMNHQMDSSMAPMSHSYSLNLPMNRNGSGTGWLPDASPMYGYMLHSKKWMYMIHGNIFIRYNNQDIGNKGTRGDTKVDAPNWFMAMGQRRVGMKGLFHFNAMFSLDPIFGGDGYPLLFQTGEAYNGKPLIDRQHPHDLFSELSVAYTQSFTKDLDAFVYFGYPGEPALGPVAFMHRPSTLNNPDATLGHHWSDATHITFGVATLGFRYKIFKIDGSLFTGREPNEERYDFDKPRFDSYSYRLTVNPNRTLSMQVSKAFINSPEELDPDEDVDRTTASITHVLPMTGENRFLTSTFVWGYNDSGPDHSENSFTLESNLQLDRLAVYGKYENVEKSAEELILDQFEEHKIFKISALTLGVNYTILRQLKTNFAVGAQGSVFMADATLDPIYGKNPMSAEVYVRISPTLMNMNGMKMK